MFGTDSIRGRRNPCFANSLITRHEFDSVFGVEKMKATPKTELIPGFGKGLFSHWVSGFQCPLCRPGILQGGFELHTRPQRDPVEDVKGPGLKTLTLTGFAAPQTTGNSK